MQQSGVMRGFAIALGICAGCDGILQEKPSQSNIDASPLNMVQPPPCDQPQTAMGDGHHNPGDDCLMCHHQGGMAPPYTFAGTLFGSSGGAQPIAGATIHLIDAMGTDVVVVSAANGNFWSTDLVVPPVLAFASSCPTVVPMIAPINTTDGSCNTSGCHTSGFRVHLP